MSASRWVLFVPMVVFATTFLAAGTVPVLLGVLRPFVAEFPSIFYNFVAGFSIAYFFSVFFFIVLVVLFFFFFFDNFLRRFCSFLSSSLG